VYTDEHGKKIEQKMSNGSLRLYWKDCFGTGLFLEEMIKLCQKNLWQGIHIATKDYRLNINPDGYCP